jgi:hypothetical protein
MAAEQPAKLPQWATNGGTTVEPALGEKQVGWEVDKKPPARFMNWLLNNLYTWTQYLQAPKGTGAGAGVDALGGDTSGPGLKGTGGTPNGDGVEGVGTGTGHGINGTGGAGAGSVGVVGTGTANPSNGVQGFGVGTKAGVQGTGASSGPGVNGVGGSSGRGVVGVGGATTGAGVHGTATAGNSSGVVGVGQGSGRGVNGTGGATGFGVYGVGGATSGAGVYGIASAGNSSGVGGQGNGTGTGVGGTGGTTSGVGVRGTGGAPNGNGVEGNAVGTGEGVRGTGVDGYGVVAESDTTSPNRSAFRMVPQDTEPSTPLAGDVFPLTATGKIRNYNGQEWERQVPQNHAIVADETETDADPVTPDFFTASQYTIPANTLKAGTTLRIRGSGTMSGSVNAGLRVQIGTSANVGFTLAPLVAGKFQFDITWTIRSIAVPAAATNEASGFLIDSAGGVYVGSNSTALDTTGALDVKFGYTASTTPSSVTLEQYVIDIA